MKKKFLITIIILVFSLTPNVQAGRGCCSHHGGPNGECRNGKQVCVDGTTSPSCTCSGGNSYSNSSNSNNIYTPPEIYGCTNPDALNYNPNATRNDASCIQKVYGCLDQNALNYNKDANVDDGNCIAKVTGCIKKEADNYNKNANVDDGSCLYTKTKISYKKIKYKTKYKYSFFKKTGTVIQKGKNGKKKITKKITINDNKQIINSRIIKQEIIKEPTPKIIVTKKR